MYSQDIKEKSVSEFMENYGGEYAKLQIKKCCKRLPAYKDGMEGQEEIAKYIYPQIMKAKIKKLTLAADQSEIETNLGIILIKNEIEISWSIEAVILAKKYLNKKYGKKEIEGDSIS